MTPRPHTDVLLTPVSSSAAAAALLLASNVSHTSGAGQQHSPDLLTIPSSSATNNDICRSLQDELETTWDILLNSKLYYDERWDNASILSADSEVYRATVDPSLPHYPDRNDFWREHCRVRERKARQLQLQQIHLQTSERAQQPQQRDHQLYPEDVLNEVAAVSAVQDPLPSSATIPLDNVNSIQLRCHEGREIALDARTLLEHQQSQLAHEFKPQLRRAMTPQSTRAPTFGSNGRARFKTYSAFISAMQEEQKKQCFLTLNETDQKDLSQARYFAAADSLAKTKLLDDMRALRERALSQQAARYAACRSRLADLFEGPITAEMPPQVAQLGVQVKKGPVPRTVDLEPSDNTHRMCPSRLSVNSTNIHHTLIKYQPSSFGQSDGEEEAEVKESAMPDALHHLNDTHAPKGPEQGILFMSTLPATVELSLSPPQFSLEAVEPSPKTDTQQPHAGPTAVADKFARGFPKHQCLPADYLLSLSHTAGVDASATRHDNEDGACSDEMGHLPGCKTFASVSSHCRLADVLTGAFAGQSSFDLDEAAIEKSCQVLTRAFLTDFDPTITTTTAIGSTNELGGSGFNVVLENQIVSAAAVVIMCPVLGPESGLNRGKIA
ncbi:hypothetical protein DFQ27_001831 [Actinomortierella ambigua]|uniref:Uncharacterized protein n=1 Tax=Actinomortierella ambigua TaxID=1343610 RepID=A0A9P6Q9A4_9FUNG|nr:hypothetical protein DFQ27_001831 [Actinomortierella ambigua]